MLACAGWHKIIKVFDSASGKDLYTLAGHSKMIGEVVFSPDSKTLASCSRDKTIKLWDTASGTDRVLCPAVPFLSQLPSVRTARQLLPAVFPINRSNSGMWLLEKSCARDTKHPKVTILAVAFSPDGQTLAAAAQDVVELWDISSGKELPTLKGHSKWIRSVRFSPDGRALPAVLMTA